MGFMSLSNVQK